MCIGHIGECLEMRHMFWLFFGKVKAFLGEKMAFECGTQKTETQTHTHTHRQKEERRQRKGQKEKSRYREIKMERS